MTPAPKLRVVPVAFLVAVAAVAAAVPPRAVAADEPPEVARAEGLLRGITKADRDAKLKDWADLDALGRRSDAVRDRLAAFARDESSDAEPFARYVAATVVAGFGRPTRIGPNSLSPGTRLGWYVDLQRGTPVSGPRRLGLDPSLKELQVEVPPNAANDLTFAEILWTILDRHHLAFRLDPDGTFLILPPPSA